MPSPILPDSLDSMFPRKQLSFKDFGLGEPQYGTITSVYLKTAQVRAKRWGNQQQRAEPDIDPEWMLELKEFRLPLPLRKSRAKTVAIALGTDNPREWIGRRICFYRAQKVIGGETIEGLFIDDRPVIEDPVRQIGPVTKFKADDTRALPPGFMDRFIAHMAQHGKKWDDFLMWTKGTDLTAFAGLFGIPLEDVRFGAKDVMAAYLVHLNAPASPAQAVALAPAAANPGPAQLRAGQSVVGTPSPSANGSARSFNFDAKAAPGGPQAKPGPAPIDDSDIPF